MDLGSVLSAVDVVARESALFAGAGLLVGGIDDIAVDLIYLASRPRSVPVPRLPWKPMRRFAILVPVWDEFMVIGQMLTALTDRLGPGDYRIYVGLYPNDAVTIAAVREVAVSEPRIRPIVGGTPGPTTKGDNLNVLWRAMTDQISIDGWSPAAIVLHDAEDLVDRDELMVFDALLDRYDVVQLPILPLIAPHSRWVSGHYADEFVETAARSLAVRQLLGAGLPLAGTGCAIRYELLAAVALARNGTPFDRDSLTEDYELGLALATHGGRGCLARMHGIDGRPVAVRSYFPTLVTTAVRQKARWITGIALLGWDRIGWGGAHVLAEYWMRMRDRRALLAMVLVAMAYAAMLLLMLSVTLHMAVTGDWPPTPGWLAPLFFANALVLAWRLAMRALATGRIYGWREGLRAMPRLLVANFIGLLAGRRALASYLRVLRGAAPQWDKTRHIFPTAGPVGR